MPSKRITTTQLIFVLFNACQSASSFVAHNTRQARSDYGVAERRKAQQQQQQPLFVAAFAEEEKEKNKKRRRQNNDNNDSTNADWIETPTGGFIPNIRQKILSKVTRKSKEITKKAPPRRVQEVLTIEEYKDVVVDEKEQMVVVRFYAPWCKACKAVAPLFQKLAKTHQDKVKFVEVPVTKENSYLHQGLGIPSLPYGHIYHPEVGLVEECKVNKKDGHFKQFQELLQTYVDGECLIKDEQDENKLKSNHFYHEKGNDNEFQ